MARLDLTRLDRVNRGILEALQRDGRVSYSDLARALKRAESTVRERVAHLEHTGIIKGYRAVVDDTLLGFEIHALVRANYNLTNVSDMTRRILTVPQVRSAKLTTGPKPLIIEVIAENLTALARMVETRLAPLGLEGIEVTVVVDNLVEPRATPVEAAQPPLRGSRSNSPNLGAQSSPVLTRPDRPVTE